MTPPTSNSKNNRLLLALGGCAVLALCLCVIAAAAGGGFYFWQQRSTTTAEPAVEYILDASPRMGLPFEDGTRLNTARAVLGEVVRPADPDVLAGLRVFGSGAAAEACHDTDLLVPLAPSNQGQIADSAFSLEAGAATDAALAEAMLAAIRDLAAAAGPHTLVVITGGVDSCNAQAGQLLRQEAEKAGIKLQEFVIGFAVEPVEAEAIKSMVVDSGGDYYDAPDAATLTNLLSAIQNHIDHPSPASLTTIQTAATPGAVVVLPTPPDHIGLATEAGPFTAATSPFTLPGVEGYAAQTACDHPYFPIRSGASWQYTSSDGFGYTWTVSSVSGDLSSATATILFALDSATITWDWLCGADGVSYFTGGGMVIEGGSYVMTITENSGASLLSASKLVPGATWSSGYTMVTDFSGQGVSFSTTSVNTETNTAGAIQSLASAVGTLDVLPVTSQGTYTVSGPNFPATTSNYTSVVYYAYGVGIVRMESSSDGGSSTTELVSYSVP